MIDRAPQVAAFLIERQDHDDEPEALWAEMRRRWPSLTVNRRAKGTQDRRPIGTHLWPSVMRYGKG